MDLHAVDDLLAHKGHSNEKLEEVDELLQHGAKISQQTTYIGGEKTLGEVEGVLEKLSGSKSGKHGILGHGHGRWQKRYFVLSGATLNYYKSKKDAIEHLGGEQTRKKVAPAGSIEIAGATVFVKKTFKDGEHRFTVRVPQIVGGQKTGARDLKMRAADEESYQGWVRNRRDNSARKVVRNSRIRPLLRSPPQVRELEKVAREIGDEETRVSVWQGGDGDYHEDDDDDDSSGDDDDGTREAEAELRASKAGPSFGRERSATTAERTTEGWLEKKSGGHEGKSKMRLLQHWEKRWFVLPAGSTELSYYKDEAHLQAGKPAGAVELTGATAFLKSHGRARGISLASRKSKGEEVYRFTILGTDKDGQRELKLKASCVEDYEEWEEALKAIVGEVGDMDSRKSHAAAGDGDDDDDDE